ncbi:putative membrane protein [Synechococcus sp. MVIR-18-1]|nr:putative membrane protein [Synechococcus sp. MVIR-18-1]
MALGDALGWINSYIILGLVFVVVLQPNAYIMRLYRYDPLREQRKSLKTYREIISNKHIDTTRIF